MFALISCTGEGDKGLRELPPAAQSTVSESDIRAVTPNLVADEPVKIGDPYLVDGKSYTPQAVSSYDEVGYASWYGADFEGKATANGESFAAARISGAHKSLPLPTYVEVTALKTGRTILVRLNDRGPFTNDRLLDLSHAAASQLGIVEGGVAPVRVRMVNPPQSERMALRNGEPASERIATPDSLLKILRIKLAEEDASKVAIAATDIPPSTAAKAGLKPVASAKSTSDALPAPTPTTSEKPVKQTASVTRGALLVQVGAFSNKANADAVAAKSGGQVYPSGKLFRVRTGPFASATQANKGVAQARANGYPDARIVRAD